MLQLSLQFLNNKDNLMVSLERMTGKPLSLTITDNSTSLLSIRTRANIVAVRMHWMFLKAGEDVIEEIAGFIKTGRGRTPLIRNFIRENRTCLRQKERSSRPPRMRAQGRFYDLKDIFDDCNKEYFEGAVTASIGWGKENLRRVVRKRTLGTYCRHTDTIRINSVLDRRTVPLYFIRYVVYHEMLHSNTKEERKIGRRSVHNPEFRKRERSFKEYEKATSWEKRHGI
jgi:hypothetical protein